MFRIVILVCVILLVSSLLIYEIFAYRRGGKAIKDTMYAQWTNASVQYRLYHSGVLCDEDGGHALGVIELGNLPKCFMLETIEGIKNEECPSNRGAK